MFDRIRRVFQREPKVRDNQGAPGPDAHAPLSEWATSRGMTLSGGGSGQAVSMHGQVGRHAWRMEVGKPTRDYISGEELRARAELGLFDDVAAMIINRPLKEALERRAYGMITDTLQTIADPHLPEEMRWLAMYNEIGWEGPQPVFWERYAVLADKREHALAWVDDALVNLILEWPEPAPAPQVPFMIVVLRGKCYLRMQYEPRHTRTVEHASKVFTLACESALGAFGPD